MIEIVSARPLPNGHLLCLFNTGEKKVCDIRPSMHGVLEILKDEHVFNQVVLDAGTVTWGDHHIDPETLYRRGVTIEVDWSSRKVEQTAIERVSEFDPNISLAEALHRIGVKDLDVQAILKLSEEMEL